jgi:hypothetical protein
VDKAYDPQIADAAPLSSALRSGERLQPIRRNETSRGRSSGRSCAPKVSRRVIR